MSRTRSALAPALLALVLAACATTPSPEPVSDSAELEADVCATTQSFSILIRQKSKDRPPSVLLAHAAQWFDLAYAYTTAKGELERCIDPALGATFTTGTEVWEGMPPVTATAKFDAHDVGSFTDRPSDSWGPQSSLARIELETLDTASGVELRLSVR
jgi:hypothetical protein